VFALLLGWLTTNKRYGQTRSQVFKHVRDLGGFAVAYPEMPDWICRWVEDDFYKMFDAVRIDLSSANGVDDAVLEQMAKLRRVDKMDLSGTQIRGPGLTHLQGKGLRILNLSGTPMSDEGAEYLKQLESLEHLYLSG
jgi:hypothetical protein